MREVHESTLVTPYASIEKVEAPFGQAEPTERARGVLLEAKLLWHGDALGIRLVAPRAELRIRDLGLDVPGGDDLVVAARDASGHFALRLPNGAVVPPACRMNLRVGRATLRLTLVADDAVRLPRTFLDPRVARGVLVAALVHLVVLALVAHGREDVGVTEESARADLQRMVAAAEERAQSEVLVAQQKPRDDFGAAANAKEQGAAGNVAKTNEVVAAARTARGEARRTKEARDTAELASEFGLITLLTADDSRTRGGTSAFAAESGPSALGNIFGQTIDDAAGLGGLGLSGAGEGGGGKGAGVTLGAIGTLGNVGGVGQGQGFGIGHCRGCRGPEHVVRSPVLYGGEGSQVNGRLPPEAVQRVVRLHFNRLRYCYERGLERRPDLEGRVAVKFVIDRAGEVALASGAERTLDDTAVADCVVKTFQSMTFPQPEGGIVTVLYPVVFTRAPL